MDDEAEIVYDEFFIENDMRLIKFKSLNKEH